MIQYTEEQMAEKVQEISIMGGFPVTLEEVKEILRAKHEAKRLKIQESSPAQVLEVDKKPLASRP
jgi:hypothetical protein